jgi:hypothetical protein
MRNFITHLEGLKEKQWSWVVNFSNTKNTKEIPNDVRKMLVNTLLTEHAQSLQTIYIMNAPAWLSVIAFIIRPFIHNDLLDKVHFYKQLDELFKELGQNPNVY